MFSYFRSVSGKISMRSLDSRNKEEAIFTINGETEQYTVSITNILDCTCKSEKAQKVFSYMYFKVYLLIRFRRKKTRRTHCKHIKFILTRFFQIPPTNDLIVQWKYTAKELSRLWQETDWKADVGMFFYFTLNLLYH